MPFFFIFLFVFLSPIWTQEVLTSNVETDTSQEYRPGLNFQSVELDTRGSSVNLIESASVSSELTEVGRPSAIRLSGAVPLLGIDGFVIKDPSISRYQMNLDLLPHDFANRVDLYKQNLVPFGINAWSFIDFRIPITHSKYTSILAKASTDANMYTKIQSEQPFQDGSTFFGVVLDYGFKDYQYAIDGGADFATYPNSTYERTSLISKTTWKGLEFLLAHTYVKGYTEAGVGSEYLCPVDSVVKNNLITGVRYNKDIFTVSANYTFYNMYVEPNPEKTWDSTNDYNVHQLNLQVGVKDKVGRYSYTVLAGYEFNDASDGDRAAVSNYNGVPTDGEHFFNVVTEFGVAIVENSQMNLDLNLALNQIVSTKGKYTPVPNISLGLRHQNGLYSSLYISRVYTIPDLISSYGWGTPSPTTSDLVPEDGVKTGLEIGVNKSLYRIYANASYSWLDKGFKLDENWVMQNTDQVTIVSTEVGAEFNHITSAGIKQNVHTAVAWNKSEDKDNIATSTMPEWKWITSYSVGDIEDLWKVRLSYQLATDVPNTKGKVDNTIRHYLDLHLSYNMFFVNILNLANQSYRTIPFDYFSPYNSGIKAEFGIQYKFD